MHWGIVCCFAICFLSLGCGKREEPKVEPAPTPIFDVAKIQRFCGDCHEFPNPDTFPKFAWNDEVIRGFRFYKESNRSDLEVPDKDHVLAYFVEHAPEDWQVVASSEDSPSPVRFESQTLSIPNEDARTQSVSHLMVHNQSIYWSDMKNGGIWAAHRNKASWDVAKLGSVSFPARFSFEGDLQSAWVADLGSYFPEDHDRGSVARLDIETKEAQVVFDNAGRIADARSGDFDSDGDLDVIVAEFGWHETGGIWLLRRTGEGSSFENFERVQIDSRSGPIHVPVVDLNGDGALDFLALTSQEFEEIDAYINDGKANFKKEVVHLCKDPSYGSSGIEMVDFDSDGDQDVLYTNGDNFDGPILRKQHGVHWLENQGKFPFVHHELTKMPGVHRASMADLDGDGDLDIACSSFLPKKVFSTQKEETFDSLIWLERTAKLEFQRHIIEKGDCTHAAMALADLDGDQRVDIVVGGFDFDENIQTPITIFWNRGIPPASE